jgi:uncharacterized protein YcaQ
MPARKTVTPRRTLRWYEFGVHATAEQARRFLVARQFLSPARSLTDPLDVFRRWGSVQYDPISVAGRAHDLVLHARVADYVPAWTDALYEERKIFEAFNKGLSLVPVEELPWFDVHSPRQQKVLDENAEVAARVLQRIRDEGPLSSADFERQAGPTADWFGMPTNAVRASLEAYTLTGVLGLARRDGTRRYYDLRERLLPPDVLAQKIPFEEQIRHKLLSRYRAHGLLGIAAGDTFGNLGPAAQRNAARAELLERGELVPVTVEGLGKKFVVADEVALLEDPPKPAQTVAFVAPFDPLVWDRKLLGTLFGFHYVWELFLPPEKRRWGWYTLPSLFGDRLVGRFDPRIERDEGAVRVVGAWWEDGFDPGNRAFRTAMREALRAYLRFAGVKKLDWDYMPIA